VAPHSRRGCLGLAALAPLAAASSSRFLEPLTENRSDPWKGIDLFGVCDFCAEHDIEAVDLTGYFFPGYPLPPDDDCVSRMKRHVHDLGLVISGTGVNKHFATADKGVRVRVCG